ncbi:hypothetical protein RCL_jg19168.t1 [Rhizophagus clarus]|uniref:Uncharacterized protein n=1 Tax=Rhizophagus clarus TaxID=94130 RepID=A0A8H3LZN5_9GLOM|nr:hypothetical protein RCL_jg19168.t1 [Rhizophagus clarus]
MKSQIPIIDFQSLSRIYLWTQISIFAPQQFGDQNFSIINIFLSSNSRKRVGETKQRTRVCNDVEFIKSIPFSLNITQLQP